MIFLKSRLFLVSVCLFVQIFFTNPTLAIRRVDVQEEREENVVIPHLVQNQPDFSVDDIPEFVVIPCMWHVHTTWSDGWASIEKVKKSAKKAGFQCIFFSDHSDMVGDYEQYQKYYKALRSLNEEGKFVAIVGREISVPKKSLCHLNAVSLTNIPFMSSSEYKQSDLPKVLDKLDREGAIYVANHIKDCKEWEKWISFFHGVELMNYLNNSRYKYYLDLYLKNKANGWSGFVVGGIDLHTDLQKIKMGEIYTYIFPESLTTPDVLSAIADGRTIATKNLKILGLNVFPSLSSYSFHDSFVIRGSVRTKMQKIPEKVNLYKDGKFLAKFSFDWDEQDVNTYWFNIKINDTGCYILEIPQQMVTSSFCFRKEEGTVVAAEPEPISKKSCPPEMAMIKSGEFLMGADEEEIALFLKNSNDRLHREAPQANYPADYYQDYGPKHLVKITQDFCVDIYEVRRGDFIPKMGFDPYSVMRGNNYMVINEDDFGGNPTHCRQDDCIVEMVDWPAAKQYCESIGKRLPTEAEWEYSARAGSTSIYYWGDDIDGRYLWYVKNEAFNIHPGGQKIPNAFGLYDMLGNASEWTADCFSKEWYQNSPTENPFNNKEGCEKRVVRGGYWDSNPENATLSTRTGLKSKIGPKYNGLGFRCASDPQ